MSGSHDGVAQAIAELASAVHSQMRDMDGKAIGPMDANGTPVTSLADAVTAVAWSAELIADAINRLALAIDEHKGGDRA